MSGKKRRTVHINEKCWTYSIGRSYIQIWNPNKEKHVTEIYKFLGMSHKDWGDALWDRCCFPDCDDFEGEPNISVTLHGASPVAS